MILIAFTIQIILLFFLKSHKTFSVIGVGLLMSLINFFDLFSQYSLLKLSITANIIYIIIMIIFLIQQINKKNVKAKNIIFFSFIFATMNTYIIAVSLLLSLIFNQETGLDDRPKTLIKLLCVIFIGDYFFGGWNISFLIPFLILVGLALSQLRLFTASSFSYFTTSAFITAAEGGQYYTFSLVGAVLAILILREFIANRKEKIVRNDFIDKVTFSLLITPQLRVKRANIVETQTQSSESTDIAQYRNDIVNKEDILDLLLAFLAVGSITYLGATYGNI